MHYGMLAAMRNRSSAVVVLAVLLGMLGVWVAVMGVGVLVQNVGCQCVAAGTPGWAWFAAPVAIILAGVVVAGCAAFVAFAPRLPLRRQVGVALVVAAATEAAALLGSSYALVYGPNRGVLVPFTIALTLLLPAVLLTLRARDARVRTGAGPS